VRPAAPLAADAVVQLFRDCGALLEGHFLLSSGLHSPYYLQCARLLMDPRRAEQVCAVEQRAVFGILREQRRVQPAEH